MIFWPISFPFNEAANDESNTMKRLTITTLVMTYLLTAPLASWADDDSFWSWFSFKRIKGVKPVENSQYQEECGACHFAYQPGLLPARSWKKLFAAEALADHFGENAELDNALRQQLEAYVLAHAAETSRYKRSKKIAVSTPADAAPLRITEVRYIRRKHEKIPEKLVRGNEQVKSLSYCDACHTKAAEGVFDDDTVFIKGHGPFDD